MALMMMTLSRLTASELGEAKPKRYRERGGRGDLLYYTAVVHEPLSLVVIQSNNHQSVITNHDPVGSVGDDRKDVGDDGPGERESQERLAWNR